MLLPVDRWIVHNKAFLLTLIFYVYALYFVYRRTCIPKLFMQKKYIRIALLMVTLAAITLLLTYFPMPTRHSNPQQAAARLNMRTQTIWFFFLMVTGFSFAIELTFELFKQMLAKQEIAAEMNKAELALYRVQINPHFLFNTLNTLYALVLSGSDKTESAFVKFSGILKYISADTNCDINININLKNGCLNFNTVNSVIRQGNSAHKGIGLSNCRKRLELLYPGRYELETKQQDNKYVTKLKI